MHRWWSILLAKWLVAVHLDCADNRYDISSLDSKPLAAFSLAVKNCGNSKETLNSHRTLAYLSASLLVIPITTCVDLLSGPRRQVVPVLHTRSRCNITCHDMFHVDYWLGRIRGNKYYLPYFVFLHFSLNLIAQADHRLTAPHRYAMVRYLSWIFCSEQRRHSEHWGQVRTSEDLH